MCHVKIQVMQVQFHQVTQWVDTCDEMCFKISWFALQMCLPTVTLYTYSGSLARIRYSFIFAYSDNMATITLWPQSLGCHRRQIYQYFHVGCQLVFWQQVACTLWSRGSVDSCHLQSIRTMKPHLHFNIVPEDQSSLVPYFTQCQSDKLSSLGPKNLACL